MNNNTLLNLIKQVEPQVVSVLVAKGLVHLSGQDMTLNNCVVNDSFIINEHPLLEEEFLLSLKNRYPKEGNCSISTLKDRMKDFVKRTRLENITKDEVSYALDNWLQQYSPPYSGKLINFLFLIKDRNTYTSRLEDIIVRYREDLVVTESSKPQVYNDIDDI